MDLKNQHSSQSSYFAFVVHIEQIYLESRLQTKNATTKGKTVLKCISVPINLASCVV